MTERFKFVSNTTGGIHYVAINHTTGEYTTDYYADNGGWSECKMVKLKRIREITSLCESLNLKKVDRLTR